MIKDSFRLSILTLLVFQGFLACSPGSRDVKAVQAGQVLADPQAPLLQSPLPQAEPVPGPAPQQPIPVPAAMVGTWIKLCKPVAEEDEETGAYSVYEEMSIGAMGELSIARTYYEGTKCKSKNRVQTVKFVGSVTLTADMIKANDNFKSYVTYYDNSAIEQANQAKTCGAADWSWGVEHMDCLSQQGGTVLDAQYSIHDRELAIFACETDDLDQCASDVYFTP